MHSDLMIGQSPILIANALGSTVFSKTAPASSPLIESAQTDASQPLHKTQATLSIPTTDMCFSVDHMASDLTVVVINQSTGEVIRKLNFKGLNADVFNASKLTGRLVDIKG